MGELLTAELLDLVLLIESTIDVQFLVYAEEYATLKDSCPGVFECIEDLYNSSQGRAII